MKKLYTTLLVLLMISASGQDTLTFKVRGLVCSFCAHGLNKGIGKLPFTDEKSVWVDVKNQNEDLDKIRQSITKAETKMVNVEGIVLKMLDRWNRSDEISQRHREDIVKELNDVTDDLAYLKGRINGK